jgi:hypothetical protein
MLATKIGLESRKAAPFGAALGLSCCLRGLARQNLDHAGAERYAARGRGRVEERAVTDASGTHVLEQLHRRLGRQRDPIVHDILRHRSRDRRLARIVTSRAVKATGSDDLLDQSGVLVDLEVLSAVDLAVVKHIFDGDLSVIVTQEVVERDRRFHADEGVGEVVDGRRATGSRREQVSRHDALVETRPRPAGRVNLVRFEVTLVLKVLVVLVDEVPHLASDGALRPRKPILHGRLHVEHRPAIKFRRVHLAYLILRAMLATVDGSDDVRAFVESVPVDLAGVGEFEETLSNLGSSAVDLIDEEHDGLSARNGEPIGRVPSRDPLAADLRIAVIGQSKQIALGHLRSAPLHDREAKGAGGLIDDLGLADAVATTEEDGLADVENEGGERVERREVDSHMLIALFAGC